MSSISRLQSLRSSLRLLRSRAGEERQPFDATFVEAEEAVDAALLLQEQEAEQNFRPFRFIDLPLELQKMVYSLYAGDIEDKYKPARASFASRWEPKPMRQLANLRIPALAQVCQEIRVDFLQTLLEEGNFIIVLGPLVPSSSRSRPLQTPAWTSEALVNRIKKTVDHTDPILLGKHMSSLLGPNMIVRNVRFSFHDLNERSSTTTLGRASEREGTSRFQVAASV